MIDLSEYMKKKDGVTLTELQSLTSVVANKLDATPQHKHDISDIKDLREELEGKYDTSKQYPCNVILSDVEKIPYLEAPKIGTLEIVTNSESSGYKLYVDDSSGDLMVVSDDILIATYIKATGNWILGGVNLSDVRNAVNMQSVLIKLQTTVTEHDTHIKDNSIDIVSTDAKINALTAKLDEYISKTDAVLKNHYNVLMELCGQHGMLDNNDSDGAKITTDDV